MNIKNYIKLDIAFFLLLLLLIYFFINKITYKQKLTSYRIYYNNINSDILDKMINYDLVIVEASFFKKEDIEFLHNNNTKAIGYLSLIEIGSWDKELTSKLDNNDYLKDENNTKLRSLDDSNYLGDLSSEHFRSLLLETLEKRIVSKGFDGVFFDTLDWIDYYQNNPVLYDKLSIGYNKLLKEIKLKFPNLLLFQNRSFNSYFSFSKNYISAILWENFNSPFINDEKTKIKIYNNLKKHAKLYKTDVYLISFTNDYINKIIAKKNNYNYLYSQMENRYSIWDIETR